jgi:factor associated with neutral sphingomyelinase activation
MLGMHQKKSRKRFNLLLFEEREYYFDQVGCIMFEPSTLQPVIHKRKQLKGRLHIGSKTLVFDPENSRSPVIRSPLRKITAVKRTAGNSGEYFTITTTQSTEIEPRSPFNHRTHGPLDTLGIFGFSVIYVPIERVLSQVSTLHGLTKMQDSKDREDILKAMVETKEAAIKFDTSRIADIREKPQLDDGEAVVCAQITPLVTHPGCLMVTDNRIYFQPFQPVGSLIMSQHSLNLI